MISRLILAASASACHASMPQISSRLQKGKGPDDCCDGCAVGYNGPFYNEGGVQIGTFSNSVARIDSNTVITQVTCQRLPAAKADPHPPEVLDPVPYCDSRCNLLFLQALLLSQQPGVNVPVVYLYTHTHTHIYTSCVSTVARGQIAGLTLVNPAVQNNINVNAQPTARQVETPEAAGKAPISSAVGQPGESSGARYNVKTYACTAGCACSLRTMAQSRRSLHLMILLQDGMGAVCKMTGSPIMQRRMSSLI